MSAGKNIEDSQQIEILEKVIKAYEKIIKLNEQEMSNQDEIIQMYETISETFRSDLMEAQQAATARDAVSSLASEELKKSMQRIAELEKNNKELRKQAAELKPE